jgi:hypothetical protein
VQRSTAVSSARLRGSLSKAVVFNKKVSFDPSDDKTIEQAKQHFADIENKLS